MMVNKNQVNYDKILNRVYFNEKNPFSYADASSLKKACPKVPIKIIREFLQTVPAYTRHKARKFAFRRSRVQSLSIDDSWHTDLLDLPALKSYNNNRRFVLVVQDVFSKFIWLYSLKNKASDEIVQAFKDIFKSRVPLTLFSDEGSEFKSNAFKKLLKQHGVRSVFLYSDKKACIAERLVRTIKNKIFRIITHTGDFNYIKRLPAITIAYNSRPHSSTGIAPKNVNKTNESLLWNKLYGNCKLEGSPKLAEGDIVRLAIAKSVFQKTYKGTFTKEPFIIHKVIRKDPCMYIVKDMEGNLIKGGFYYEELVKIKM